MLILTYEVRKVGDWKVVIYADVLFGINFFMDLIVLSLFNWIGKMSAHISKIVLAACLGAIWSVIVACMPIHLKGVVVVITYTIIPYCMIAIMTNTSLIKGLNQIRKMLKNIILLMTITFVLSGAINWVMGFTKLGLIINGIILKDSELMRFLAISVFLVVIMFRNIFCEKNLINRYRTVDIAVLGENVTLTVLADTGNSLVDVKSNKPVTIVEKELFEHIFKEINIDDLYKINYHYISYHTVGVENAVIEVVTADYIRIYEQGNKERLLGEWKKMPLGLSDMKVSTKGDYSGLIGGYLCEK